MTRRILLALAAVLSLAAGAAAQEITSAPMPGAPARHGGPVLVNVAAGTAAVGVYRLNVTVPPDRLGQVPRADDFVLVRPAAAGGLAVGTVLHPVADVVSPGVVRLTFTTPGAVAVTLGTIPVVFRWSGP